MSGRRSPFYPTFSSRRLTPFLWNYRFSARLTFNAALAFATTLNATTSFSTSRDGELGDGNQPGGRRKYKRVRSKSALNIGSALSRMRSRPTATLIAKTRN